MISIVCVYNDGEILKNYLLKSLENQTVEFEFIKIDNTKNAFKSAAEVLNYGAKKANGKYIMFVHQDVDLSSRTWIECAEKTLDSIDNLGIAGVAGMSEEGRTNKDRGKNVIRSMDNTWGLGNPIQKPEPVQTLDECLAIIPKKVFDKFRFDEKTCNDWHLYIVDYCLSMKKAGLGVYVIPMYIHHKSIGFSSAKYLKDFLPFYPLPKRYYETLGKVCKKHRLHFNKIYTTCGTWNTSYLSILLQKINRVILLFLCYLWTLSGFRFLWKRLRSIVQCKNYKKVDYEKHRD